MKNAEKSNHNREDDPNTFARGPDILIDKARDAHAITARRQDGLEEILTYLNENYSIDRPASPVSRRKGLAGLLARLLKKVLRPFARAGIGDVLERQRAYNSKLVQAINEIMDILEKQHQYNEEQVRLLHDIKIRLDLARTYLDQLQGADRKLTKRMDDQFADQNRALILSHKIETLEKEIRRLEERLEKGSL